jgi:hypothetical protein
MGKPSGKGCTDDQDRLQGRRLARGPQWGKAGGMSVSVMADVWRLDLPPMEKLVLLALADWANDEGRCWPSATTLASKTGEGERTVRRAIQSLIAKGVLSQNQRAGTTPIYTVTPCQSGTPARAAPLSHRPDTPARAAPNTSGTVNSSEPKGSSHRAYPPPKDVPPPVWDDFMKSPKRRKAGMSSTAYAGIKKNLAILAEHGFPPGDMIALAVERGWTTVRLDWVQNDGRTNRMAGNQSPDGLSATARAGLAVFGAPGPG